MIEFDFTFWIQAANFFILMIILHYFIFKPVLAMAEKRAAKIAQLEADATRAQNEGERILADYEQKIADMKRESTELIAAARKDAADVSSGIVAKAQEEFSKELADSMKKLQDESSQASEKLHEEMAGLAETLAQTVLGRKVS